MPRAGLTPNVVTYKHHDLFFDMEAKGVAPNCVIFLRLMRKNETSEVIQILHSIDKRNVMPDAFMFSIVVDLLVKKEIIELMLISIPQFKTQKVSR